MTGLKRVETPREVAQLRHRIGAWSGTRVPPSLWAAAAKLAAVHGASRTSKLFGLSYHSLKYRIEQLPTEQWRPNTSSMFVELRSSIAPAECQAEFENHRCAKTRIQWSGETSVDLSELVRTWMEVQ